ncbi:hypothetical protein [Streptomyces sp. NPDC091383]|uniref:hypothetical protein n=1 Tax=Streptomyces sp. NPDC091383 TaxID=3365996 RepID=UPI00381D0878
MSGLAGPVASVLRYGTGAAARRAAAGAADRLWARGVAARAVFRPEYGGWAVLVFTAPVRERLQGARRKAPARVTEAAAASAGDTDGQGGDGRGGDRRGGVGAADVAGRAPDDALWTWR